mgnify:CR=1 FL=1|tara:strand:- start:39182 stop:40198 length:1017 start_codon:yes stop_codon:yes gene_type:complete
MSNIYKVAEAAGVSPKTAARILAGQSLRSKKRESVLEAARRLGYVRNQQAANLRSGTTSVIGIIVPDMTNPFYAKVIQVMHDTCQRFGFSILLGASFGSHEEEARALENLLRYRVDGIFLNASERPVGAVSSSLCRQFISQGKPVVVSGELGEALEGCARVEVDNTSAMDVAVRHLRSRGHTRLGFLGGPQQSMGMRERYLGFRDAMARESLAFSEDSVVYMTGGSQDRVAEICRLWKSLSEKDRPSAFIAGNDMIAISALKAFEQMSVRVPEEVSIIGFDGIDLGALVSPALTTVKQPIERMAEDISQWMVGRIRGETTIPFASAPYELDLVVRDSA